MEPEKADVDAEVTKVCEFYCVNDGRVTRVMCTGLPYEYCIRIRSRSCIIL